jgi:hypothetical protein
MPTTSQTIRRTPALGRCTITVLGLALAACTLGGCASSRSNEWAQTAPPIPPDRQTDRVTRLGALGESSTPAAAPAAAPAPAGN